MARGDGYRKAQLDLTRQKIKASQLLNRLQDNALGKLELSSIQQRSCEILLRKVVPDLSAIEHKGEVTSFVAVVPDVAASAEDWANTLSVIKPTEH